MNVIAMKWACAQTSLSILEKSILMTLASLANDTMFIAGRSQKEIAKLVGCSRESANRALRSLTLLGRIGVVGTVGGDGQIPLKIYALKCSAHYAGKAANSQDDI